MKLVSEDQAWEDLANAVIIQAIEDYGHALRCIKRHPENEAAQRDADRLERFFYGQWFELLTNMEPNYLLPRLWERYGVKREMKQR